MQNAICKGRVLPDGLGLNQCFIDWKTPYPDPGSAIRCASRVGLGIFLDFYFRRRDGLVQFDAIEFDQERKNNELFLPGEKRLPNLK